MLAQAKYMKQLLIQQLQYKTNLFQFFFFSLHRFVKINVWYTPGNFSFRGKLRRQPEVVHEENEELYFRLDSIKCHVISGK